MQALTDLHKLFLLISPSSRPRSPERDDTNSPRRGWAYGDVVVETGPSGELSVPFESTDLTS